MNKRYIYISINKCEHAWQIYMHTASSYSLIYMQDISSDKTLKHCTVHCHAASYRLSFNFEMKASCFLYSRMSMKFHSIKDIPVDPNVGWYIVVTSVAVFQSILPPLAPHRVKKQKKQKTNITFVSERFSSESTSRISLLHRSLTVNFSFSEEGILKCIDWQNDKGRA